MTVAREPEHDKFVGRLFPPAVSPYINAAKRGNAVVIGYDGKERLIGFVPATERPVGMFVSIGMYCRVCWRSWIGRRGVPRC